MTARVQNALRALGESLGGETAAAFGFVAFFWGCMALASLGGGVP